MSAFAAIAFAIALPWQPPAPVSIYVFTKTDPSGFTDVNQRQRSDTVVDLRRSLGERKAFSVVDSRDAADVVVEVLERGKKDTGNQTYGFGMIRKETKRAVHVDLRVGDYSLEMESRGGKWSQMATSITKAIEKWVKENRALLDQRRPGR